MTDNKPTRAEESQPVDERRERERQPERFTAAEKKGWGRGGRVR